MNRECFNPARFAPSLLSFHQLSSQTHSPYNSTYLLHLNDLNFLVKWAHHARLLSSFSFAVAAPFWHTGQCRGRVYPLTRSAKGSSNDGEGLLLAMLLVSGNDERRMSREDLFLPILMDAAEVTTLRRLTS
jgi:hypothetical protein